MEMNSDEFKRPPVWLRWFANDCVRGFVDRQGGAPIGCHYHFDIPSDQWEISLFVSKTEVVGGPQDGTAVPSGISVDLQQIMTAFDETPDMYWQAEKVADDDDLGNHISLHGVVRGKKVWLRMLHQAPDCVGPGQLLHASAGILEDLW